MTVSNADLTAARDAGFITPDGTDLISGGDDAISNNAALIYKLLLANVFDRGEVPQDIDLNTFRDLGVHTVRSTGVAASLTNWPPQLEGQPGWLLNLTASNGLFMQYVFGGLYSRRGIFTRGVISVSSGNMGEWETVWDPDESASGEHRHRDMVLRARARRGGTIGTNGKPAVALRFDHHLENFQAVVLPKLIERRLPFALALNPERTANATVDDNVPWATIQDWCIQNGGEVWNHGGDHGDADSLDALTTQIVTSRETLEANLPSLPIEAWAPPGLAAGGYMGAAPFKTVAQNSDTTAGTMITGNHAFVAGYAPGVYRPLNGDGMIGAPHITMDSASLSSIVTALDEVETDSTGVAFMLHPNYVGEVGYIDEATLDSILDEIVARRDAGSIEVLSYSGLWVADSSSAVRHNLVKADAPAPITSSGVLVDWSPNRREYFLGGCRELRVAVTGNATYSVDVVGGPIYRRTSSRIYDSGTIRVPFTLPLDSSGDVTFRIYSSTTDCTVESLDVLAI